MKRKILILIPVGEDHKAKIRSHLSSLTDEFELLYETPSSLCTKDLSEAEIIVGNPRPDLLPQATSLRWLSLSSAGANAYVRPGVLGEDILLTNSSGAYGLSVSEHMLAVTFALIRRLPQYSRKQVDHLWEVDGPVHSIEGSTIAILGIGDIGGAYARKVKALGATIIGVRRTAKEKPDYLDEQVLLEDLDTVLPRADIVAMVLPGGPATDGLMDERRLRLMKKGSYLLNDGRGSAVDLSALKKVLREGHLAGAALDVTDPEPLPKEDDLWDFENVLITPHIAGQFLLRKTLDQVVDLFLENLEKYLTGKPLNRQVDRRHGY